MGKKTKAKAKDKTSAEVDSNAAEGIIADREVRKTVTRRSLMWFIAIFLSEHLENVFSLAPFQKEMMYLAEQPRYRLVVVMAFRGSGKSTLLNLGYALWSILGTPQKKCVVIISKTQNQAKSHFANIKSELEHNRLLASDLGPFRSDETSWGLHTLELENFGAKIISVSREQGIRGIRHGRHRPDLIICDDVEDTVSAENKTERKDIYDWFMSEVIPAGSERTKIIVLGNLLHQDSLLMKLKSYAAKNPEDSIFRAYPLLDEQDRSLWPERYTQDKIDRLRRTVPSRVWQREYLLKIYPDVPILILDV